jgi:peroxin-10
MEQEDGSNKSTYQILGYLIIFQQIISFYLWIKSISEMKQSIQSKEEFKEEKKSEKTCPHCLEVRRVRNRIELNQYTTSTPCGHLFCWECICECILNKPKCPICRQKVTLHSLTPLYHFDSQELKFS